MPALGPIWGHGTVSKTRHLYEWPIARALRLCYNNRGALL